MQESPSFQATFPSNGKLIIRVELYCEISVENDQTQDIWLALYENGTEVGSDRKVYGYSYTEDTPSGVGHNFIKRGIVSTEWLITGTAGTTHNLNIYAQALHSGIGTPSSKIYWDGSYPPIIIKAITAP